MLEHYPFERIKSFLYGEEGDFLVIQVTENGQDRVALWKSNKQAQQLKLTIDSNIAQRMHEAKQNQIEYENLMNNYSNSSNKSQAKQNDLIDWDAFPN